MFHVIHWHGFTDCGEHMPPFNLWENIFKGGGVGRRQREKNKRPKWEEREENESARETDRLKELTKQTVPAGQRWVTIRSLFTLPGSQAQRVFFFSMFVFFLK